MSIKHVPYYSRDINNPPSHLDSRQQQSWIKTAVKAKKNHQFRQHYPPFYVPEIMYQIKYINKYTTYDTMKLLIDHAEKCFKYSIDTEGEKSTKATALIQIETIPSELPKFIIILELTHLPSNDSSSKVLIKKLLQLIFRSGNTLYSWGNLAQELSKVEQEDLLCPLEADQYDIQDLFSNWYIWARSQCGGCDPSCYQQCHMPSPYRYKEKWSLQRALIYVSALFIDKSITVNYWSTLLDPKHSTISNTTREQRIRYLINDCLATTYLSKPVVDYWTFDKLKKTNFSDLFASSSEMSSNINNNNIKFTINCSSKITKKIRNNIDGQMFGNVLDNDVDLILDASDLEQISDEEIQLNQIIKSKENEIRMEEDSVNNHQVVVNVQNHQDDNEKPRKHRSAQAKKKRNFKRNTTHRLRRYRYAVRRDVYYRFNMSMIRLILKQYSIKFVHTKIDEDNGDLVIGLKNRDLRNDAEHRIPMSLFSQRSYYYYRRENHRRRN
jgi:ribosomal protein L21